MRKKAEPKEQPVIEQPKEKRPRRSHQHRLYGAIEAHLAALEKLQERRAKRRLKLSAQLLGLEVEMSEGQALIAAARTALGQPGEAPKNAPGAEIAPDPLPGHPADLLRDLEAAKLAAAGGAR